MKLSLGENICALRKAHSMTQEQLAQALEVTFASVSKWERGVATPELGLIAKMAELFGVSLDALVGFQVIGGGVEALEARISALQRAKQYEDAAGEVEKALLRYPNSFRIVFSGGKLYTAAGMDQSNPKCIRRGIALLERAILLLSQNTDPQISKLSIQREIAQCYLVLGETGKGIDLLKKYNVNGIYNSLIAIALTGNHITHTATPGYDPEAAVPYMACALGDILTDTMRTMLAYANYFIKTGASADARESLKWLIDFLSSLKIRQEKVAYVDKLIAPCYCECAHLSLRLGETEQAEAYLRLAADAARRYDATPTCRLDNLKFFSTGGVQNAITYDDLGPSAMAAIRSYLDKPGLDKDLSALWAQIQEETSHA